MKVTYNHANLTAHAITPEQVDEVAVAPLTIECDMSPSLRGNQRTMLVGFTSEGTLLEVGIEFFHYEERMHIFHCSKATPRYRTEFQKRVKQ